MRTKNLPFALPEIGWEEINEVIETMKSGWLTTGFKAKQFEKDFAGFIGADYAMTVNSGTAGLHLALEACGVKAGDKVLTTPYTFTATAEVIRYLGADPVFVDIDPGTFNMDTRRIADILSVTSGVKAIMPVHFAGQACEMDSIISLAKKHNIKIVEDAAHALPTTYHNRMVGQMGDLTVFSFYATKTITTGEGGMIVTDNKSYADRISTMRLHGISHDVFNRYRSDKPSWYYEVVAPGFKYNMPDIAAAIGIHQLKKAESFRSRREEIAHEYDMGLKGLPLRTPWVARREDTHSWHLYVIQLELEKLTIDRDTFIELGAKAGLNTSVHFIPLHLQPYWRDRYNLKPDDFMVSSDVYQRAVSLPLYSKMSDEDVGFVIETVSNILLEHLK